MKLKTLDAIENYVETVMEVFTESHIKGDKSNSKLKLELASSLLMEALKKEKIE
jgi:hypothetical protein